MKFIVTTSQGMKPQVVAHAKELAQHFAMPYIDRRRAVSDLARGYDAALVVHRDKLVLVQDNTPSFFFHPDTAVLRIKATRDPLLELIGPAPKVVLDTTMGLATDSLVMAWAGHQVTALESQELTHLIVTHGLQHYDTHNSNRNQAMRTIRTICTDSLVYLQNQSDNAFDIVYFDPMFSENIPESHNLEGLSAIANFSRLTPELLAQAERVAREKIILKAHYKDTSFELFDFERQVRPYQKFHYGVKNMQK